MSRPERGAIGDREREPREEGLLPTGDPAAGHGRGLPSSTSCCSRRCSSCSSIVFGYGFQLDTVWLYPLAFVDLLLFTVALTMFVSALNVRYRDVQHLIGLALLVWFWMTPIVYPAGTVYTNLLRRRTRSAIMAWYVYLLEPADVGRDRVPDARCIHSDDGARRLAPYSAPGSSPSALTIVSAIAAGRRVPRRGGCTSRCPATSRRSCDDHRDRGRQDVSKRFRVYREKPTSLKQRLLSGPHPRRGLLGAHATSPSRSPQGGTLG